MSLSSDLRKWTKKSNLTIDQAARGIKIELFNAVILDTRVKTGRLRGNWQTSTGQPETGTTERLDPSGSAASAEVVATVKGDTVDYITNNLPYAEVYEEKDAMIGRNVARIRQIVRNAAK